MFDFLDSEATQPEWFLKWDKRQKVEQQYQRGSSRWNDSHRPDAWSTNDSIVRVLSIISIERAIVFSSTRHPNNVASTGIRNSCKRTGISGSRHCLRKLVF